MEVSMRKIKFRLRNFRAARSRFSRLFLCARVRILRGALFYCMETEFLCNKKPLSTSRVFYTIRYTNIKLILP